MSRDARTNPIFRSAFQSPEDEYNQNLGTRPLVFDILGPDRETSLLPNGVKMVLHANPNQLSFSYSKIITRIQTKGGYVEQHWGEGAPTISMSAVTGGFKRLYSGMSNVTGGGGFDTAGTRRETIAYDKFLDLRALFHNNGSVYDQRGQIVFQGAIQVTFDGGIYIGWFTSFSVDENAAQPFMFSISADFVVESEVLRIRSLPYYPQESTAGSWSSPGVAQNGITDQKAGPVTTFEDPGGGGRL